MSRRIAERVLLLGWAGADWKIIQSLIDTGQMPYLERLINEGVAGNLATVEPVLSPMVWTSVATGARADRHGVHGFAEPRPDGTGIRPVSSRSITAQTLWGILPRAGLRSAVVGWPATHPAAGVGDLVVSDLFPHIAGRDIAGWPMSPEAVWPEPLRDPLRELRVHPADLDPEHLRYFVPDAGPSHAGDERVRRLVQSLSRCGTVHAAGTYLAEHERWDLLGVYFETIDRICHDFMSFRPPRMEGVSDEDVRLYGGVVDACYRFHDMMLGRYMRLVGPETTIVVVSGHGFHSDHLRPAYRAQGAWGEPVHWYRPYGIFVARGPGLESDELVFGASLLDVAPTVLAMLGLPVGRDMEGRVLAQIFAEPVTPDYIATHEPAAADTGRAAGGATDPDTEDDPAAQEVVKQLAALGYVERPAESATKAIEGVTAQRLFNLAEVHMAKGETAQAAELLERLIVMRPDHLMSQLRLAQCRLDLGDVAGCRALVDEFCRVRAGSPWAQIVEGMLRFVEEDWEGALEVLTQAEQRLPGLPTLHVRLGNVHLKRRDWTAAEASFRRAIEIDGDQVQAYHGLGSALYSERRYDESIESFTVAVGLSYERAGLHFHLGVALAAAGYLDGAIERLRTALGLDPSLASAHECLAAVYRAKGEPLLAQFHREEFLRGAAAAAAR